MELNPTERRALNAATGAAKFTDDRNPARRMLEVVAVGSPYARAALEGLQIGAASAAPGVRAVITAADITGENELSPGGGTMPLLAEGEVAFHGQPVALVVADDLAAARAGAALVEVSYRPLPPVLGVEEAIALQSFHGGEESVERGDPDLDLGKFDASLAKGMLVAGQEHFSPEPGVAWAEPGDEGGLRVTAAAEDLGFLRRGLASLLGLPMARLQVACPRVGASSCGSKLTGGLIPAGGAALAAQVTGLPVRFRFDREDESRLTGGQNPAYAEFHAAYSNSGLIEMVDCTVYIDGGWSPDRAHLVLRDILHHLDGAYYVPNVRFTGRVCRTNSPPHTSTLAGGAGIAALIAEEIVGEVGLRLKVMPEAVRQRNLYGSGDRGITPYGQEVPGAEIARIWKQSIAGAGFGKRRTEIDAWNKASRFAKRGIAAVPAKVGSGPAGESRTVTASVELLPDGSAKVACGEVEVGGAVRAAMVAAVGRWLGVGEAALQIDSGSTDNVGAAHHGALNADAVNEACKALRARLEPVAARRLKAVEGAGIEFAGGAVSVAGAPDKALPLADLVREAEAEGGLMLATGAADASPGASEVFAGFVPGAAVAEVLVDGFTGEVTVLRADLWADAGCGVDREFELGQMRGGFLQGVGWLTCEELVWSADGELLSVDADSYLIPTAGEAPLVFNAEVLAGDPGGGAREVGPAAYCLALSVREAIRDAVRSFGKAKPGFVLPCPASPEAVYFALHGK